MSLSPLLLVLRADSCSVARLKLLMDNGAVAIEDWGVALLEAEKRGPEIVGCVLSILPKLPKAQAEAELYDILKDLYLVRGTAKRAVEVSLEHGIDLVPEDAQDRDLLFAAIDVDSHELVQKLLSWGASAREQVNGTTTLHVAAQHACEGIISLLLDNGADVHAKTSSGDSPLSLAIRAENVEAVKCLLAHGARPPDLEYHLHQAAQTCKTPSKAVEIVRALIEAGADVSIPNGAGETPIMTASRFCRAEVMEELWRHGARMNFCTCVSWRDFRNAILTGAMGAVDFYLKNWVKMEPNWPSAQAEKAFRCILKDESVASGTGRRAVEIFLQHGIELVQEDGEDMDVFYGAIKSNSNELVEKLLMLGASVRHKVTGMRALHVASKHAGEGIIRLLLANGADVHARTSSGETPLSLSISAQITPELKGLLTSGSETPASRNDLKSAADRIPRSPPGIVEIVRALIEAGADVNIPNGAGETPIMTASWYCRAEVMEELWRHGARMNFRSHVVRRDFRNAIVMGAMSAVKFYLKNGVELKGGVEEAVKLATDSASQEMIEFFMEFDDPCSRTVEGADVLEETMSRGTTMTVFSNVLEYKYTCLKTIFAVLEKDSIRSKLNWNYAIDGPGDYGVLPELQNHVLALTAAELSVNEGFRMPELCAEKVFDDTSFILESLQHEVQSMKDMKISDSDFSFYDVLNSPLSTVVRLLHNDSIVEVLKGGAFGEDFPSYTGMITKRFRRALYRKTLAERGVKMIGALCAHLPKLPDEVKEMIVGYLTNQNLYVLTNVCQLPSNDFVATQSQG